MDTITPTGIGLLFLGYIGIGTVSVLLETVREARVGPSPRFRHTDLDIVIFVLCCWPAFYFGLTGSWVLSVLYDIVERRAQEKRDREKDTGQRLPGRSWRPIPEDPMK